MIKDVRKQYTENIDKLNGEKQTVSVSDTLASKIILGIYGCVPAYDRYFIDGIKLHGLANQSFTEKSLEQLLVFYRDNLEDFEECRSLFKNEGKTYPPMKLIDIISGRLVICWITLQNTLQMN